MATKIKAAPEDVAPNKDEVMESVDAPNRQEAPDTRSVRLSKNRLRMVSMPLDKVFEAGITYSLPFNEAEYLLGMRDEQDRSYFVEWSAANSALERKSKAIQALAESDGFTRLAEALIKSLPEEQIEQLMVAVQESSGEEVDL